MEPLTPSQGLCRFLQESRAKIYPNLTRDQESGGRVPSQGMRRLRRLSEAQTCSHSSGSGFAAEAPTDLPQRLERVTQKHPRVEPYLSSKRSSRHSISSGTAAASHERLVSKSPQESMRGTTVWRLRRAPQHCISLDGEKDVVEKEESSESEVEADEKEFFTDDSSTDASSSSSRHRRHESKKLSTYDSVRIKPLRASHGARTGLGGSARDGSGQRNRPPSWTTNKTYDVKKQNHEDTHPHRCCSSSEPEEDTENEELFYASDESDTDVSGSSSEYCGSSLRQRIRCTKSSVQAESHKCSASTFAQHAGPGGDGRPNPSHKGAKSVRCGSGARSCNDTKRRKCQDTNEPLGHSSRGIKNCQSIASLSNRRAPQKLQRPCCFAALPEDVCVRILQHLGQCELFRSGSVCPPLYRAAAEPRLYHSLDARMVGRSVTRSGRPTYLAPEGLGLALERLLKQTRFANVTMLCLSGLNLGDVTPEQNSILELASQTCPHIGHIQLGTCLPGELWSDLGRYLPPVFERSLRRWWKVRPLIIEAYGRRYDIA